MVDLSMVTSPCQVNTVIINLILKRNRLLERLKKQSSVSSQEMIRLGHEPRQSDPSNSLETGLLNTRPSCPSSKHLYVELLSKLQLRETLNRSSVSLCFLVWGMFVSLVIFLISLWFCVPQSGTYYVSLEVIL